MSRDLVLEIKSQNKDLKQKLTESKRELAEFKRAVKEANSGMGNAAGSGSMFESILKNIGLTSGKSSGTLGLLTGGLGKLAGAFGIALSAGAMFNKMLESSNSLSDEVERVQTQAGMAVNYFANSLANVDFNNFWTGLQNAITGGGEFADVLDRINTALQQLGVRSGKIDVDIARKELELASIPRGSKERIKIEQEILELKKKQAAIQGPINADRQTAANKLMQSALGYDDKQMQKYQKVIDAYLDGSNHAYEKIGNAWKTLQKTGWGTAFAPGTTNIGGKALSKEDQQEQKKALAIINKYAQVSGKSFQKAAAEAREFYRIYDVGDNGENQAGTRARQLKSQAYAGEANAIREQAAIQARITMDKMRADKAGARAAKQQEALAKKTYTANAKTIFEMKANVAYLEEKRDKTLPSSDEFSKITDEIQLWQKQIAAIEFDDNTLEGLQAQLKAVNDELARTKKGTEHFSTLKRVAQGLRDDLENLSMDEYVLNPKTTREIEGNIARLKKKMESLEPNTDQWRFYAEEVEELEKMLQKKPAKGSLLDLEYQIKEVQVILQRAPLTLPARLKLISKAEDLQRQYDNQSSGVSISVPTYTRSDAGKSKAANYEAASTSASTIAQDYQIGVIGYEDAKAKIDEINKALKELGLEPVEVKVTAKGTQKTAKALSMIGENLENVSSAFSSLGQIAEDPALDVAGIIAGAVANVMLGYAQASVAASQTGNPWVWIAFAIAGLATAMSAAASIKSATSGYAEGGIVGGASPIGDRLYARVNSGEMILNGSQQANLFKAIDEGRLGGESAGGEIEFVLRGADLYGSMKNYTHMKARAGKTISL